MHYLIEKILRKRNIEPEHLSDEEKATYDNWQRILSQEKLTVEDIGKFCEAQISEIEKRWEKNQGEEIKLIQIHTIYKKLLRLIGSPQVEREQLEIYLKNLLKE